MCVCACAAPVLQRRPFGGLPPPHTKAQGDTHVVNCLEPHPHHLLHLATSGIDEDVKLWAPTARERKPPDAARLMETNLRQQARASGGGAGGTVIAPAVMQLLIERAIAEEARREAEEGEGEEDSDSTERLLRAVEEEAELDASMERLRRAVEEEADEEERLREMSSRGECVLS